jgi:hypothetical protein
METDDTLSNRIVEGNPKEPEPSRQQIRREPDLDQYPTEVLEAVLRILKAQQRKALKLEPARAR